jgi:hypothetical protein
MSEPTQAQRDFSTQTLTTVSTLVVALAGFYFGTKAVNSGKDDSGEKKYQKIIQKKMKTKVLKVTMKKSQISKLNLLRNRKMGSR